MGTLGETKAKEKPQSAGQLFLEFEAIWPQPPFENFLEDCRKHPGAKKIEA